MKLDYTEYIGIDVTLINGYASLVVLCDEGRLYGTHIELHLKDYKDEIIDNIDFINNVLVIYIDKKYDKEKRKNALKELKKGFSKEYVKFIKDNKKTLKLLIKKALKKGFKKRILGKILKI
jgi:transcription termination factor NusB